MTRTSVRLAALLAAVLLAGCGSDQGGDTAASPTTQAPSSTVDLPPGWADALEELRCEDDALGEFPRTVVHDGGETRIESAPKRVVSIEGTTSLDLLLAMGVTPAAAGGDQDGPAVYEWQAQLAGGTIDDPGFELITKRPEVNVEAIAAARPDLIISQTGWIEGIEDRLRELDVPIVVFTWDDSGDPPDWRNNVRIVGEAVGRDGCVEEIIGDVEAAIADTRAALVASGAAERSFGAFTALDGYTAYYGENDPIGQVLSKELGLELVPSDGGQTEFSLENAGDVLVADELLATDFSADGATQAFLREPTVAPVADRVSVLDPLESGAAYYPSAVGLRLFLEILADRFG
jgi:iron complex transport system substrate-binding protein